MAATKEPHERINGIFDYRFKLAPASIGPQFLFQFLGDRPACAFAEIKISRIDATLIETIRVEDS